jgi:hypothetical protein
MKKTILLALITLSLPALAQESSVTLSGGWASASPEYFSTSLSGYRINGLYEFNPGGGKISHGLNVGYINTTGSGTNSGPAGVVSATGTSTISSVPVYYAPKIMFGKSEKFKLFIKGALGWQFGNYKIEGPNGGSWKTSDAGFYGGIGAGLALNFSEKLFLNAEYEWAYMANMYYGNGYLSTAQLGLGIRF